MKDGIEDPARRARTVPTYKLRSDIEQTTDLKKILEELFGNVVAVRSRHPSPSCSLHSAGIVVAKIVLPSDRTSHNTSVPPNTSPKGW